MRRESAGKDGSASRALMGKSGISSGSNLAAQPLRVFADSNGNNGHRKYRLAAGFVIEFVVVFVCLGLPIWIARQPTQIVEQLMNGPTQLVVPKGQWNGVPGARGTGSSDARIPAKRNTPDFDRQGERILYVSDSSHVSDAGESDPTGWIPAVVGLPWGDPDSTTNEFISGPVGIGGPPQPAPPPERVRIGGKVDPPLLLRYVEPDYPRIARHARIEGDVILKVHLSDQGEIEDAFVLTGPPLLIHPARQAVLQWRYAPTLLNGRPVAAEMDVVVRFRLNR